MIPKLNKPNHLPQSYCPISLLPILGKILQTLRLKRILLLIFEGQNSPSHQFGFRKHHSTIEQCHRFVYAISSSLQLKQYCSGVIFDVAQVFDTVWHQGLLWKLISILPSTYFLISQSFLTDHFFQVSQGTSCSDLSCGYGHYSGIDLAEERSGIMPTCERKQKCYKNLGIKETLFQQGMDKVIGLPHQSKRINNFN